LLGLFFMSVGMSLDLALVAHQWLLLAIAAPSVIVIKTILVAVLSRIFGASWHDGLRSGVLLSLAGEFAFVLLPLAAGWGLMSANEAQLVAALAALTMLIGPIAAMLLEKALQPRSRREAPPRTAGPQAHEGEPSSGVLVI